MIYESSPEFFEDYLEFLQEQKAEGKKLIGYFAHEFIPEDLLRAVGCVPVPLVFAGDEDRTTVGSEYLTNSMCPYALSHIGSFDIAENDGSFQYRMYQLIDGVLATNYCAADFLVNEWISEKWGKKRFQFHIPFMQRPHHVKFYLTQIIQLTGELSKFSGTKLKGKTLVAEILAGIELRNQLKKLAEMDIAGSERNQINQMARLFGPKGAEGFNTEKLTEFICGLKPRNKDTPSRGIPVMLTGASIFMGDDMMSFIEECGGDVVLDYSWLGHTYYNQDSSDALDAFSKNQTLEGAFSYLSARFGDAHESLHCTDEGGLPNTSMKNVGQIAKENNIKGIINHLIKFCDITGHHRHDFKTYLNEQDLLVLNLERDYSRSMQGQLRTRIEAFIEMLEEK